MASLATLLAQTDAAIEGLLTAIANGYQEYQYNGRRVRRAEFSTTLDSLRRFRTELLQQQSASTLGGVSLGRTGAA